MSRRVFGARRSDREDVMVQRQPPVMVTPTAMVTDSNTVGWRFDNTYSRLPDVLFAPAKPATVRAPRVSILNHRLADERGLDLGAMSPEVTAALFAGQDLPGGVRPIAQAYAGHQFGGFTMLGDGRAILLGEHRTPSGRLVDIQLKGAGPTPFSRRGDGLAALGPMLREYVISEAMAALGIPTTRSLAVVTTGEPVFRASALRGAILTRVAASHLRVGTFEYLAARQAGSETAPKLTFLEQYGQASMRARSQGRPRTARAPHGARHQRHESAPDRTAYWLPG